MLALSIKEMMFFKMRFLLISLILFFIASLVMIINGLANGLSMDNASSIKMMDGEAFYLQKDSQFRLDRSHLNGKSNEIDKVSEKLQPLGIQMSTLRHELNEQKLDITLMAVNPGSFLEPKVSEGAALSKGELNTIIADSSLKEEGVRVGDKLTDERTGILFEVVGFTEKQKFSHVPVAFMSLKSWDEISKGQYNSFVIQDKTKEMEKEISRLGLEGVWADKETVINGIPGYQAEQNSLFMMLSFLIVIAVFVLAAFFYIMTIQKTSQFGILKAIGAKTSYLIRLTLSQVLVLTLLSIAGAVGFTWFAVYLLPEGIPFVFDLTQMVKYSILLCAVSILGALISSFNIIKADPIQAMGRVE